MGSMKIVTPEIEARARELLGALTLPEKLRMLSGDYDFYQNMIDPPEDALARRPIPVAGAPRLGLDGLRFVDGPRGVASGACTCFPVAIARAATFDPELEERVGEAIGREARARGANLVGAPCLNVLRHPAWGRAQETYGENPQHLGEMGAAFIRGLQKHAMACVKHFACNSLEDNRFSVDVRILEDDLAGVYLPQFQRVVREGVAGVMAAYNKVNGEWCGQNRHLLTTILKERWGFEGFVMSDWLFGLRDGVAAANAGLDVEMPAPLLWGDRLARAVDQGAVPLERVDDAVLRLIRTQLRFAAVGDEDYGPEVIASAEHRALARQVATRSMVLLRNEQVDGRPVLPLLAADVRRVAVIGRLAATPNLGDHGSSAVTPPSVVTPLNGLRRAFEPLDIDVIHDDGSNPARAAAAAARADAALVVAGYDYLDEGELMHRSLPAGFLRLLPRPPLRLLPKVVKTLAGLIFARRSTTGGGDRRSLTLHRDEEDLLLAVSEANPRTVAVIMCSSAVLMERWRQKVPAILILWYPGMEGGHALADIVLGYEKPAGRLPFAIPTSERHLPFFDRKAEAIEYGALHGQALLDHLGMPAAYPYGFGLTYEGYAKRERPPS